MTSSFLFLRALNLSPSSTITDHSSNGRLTEWGGHGRPALAYAPGVPGYNGQCPRHPPRPHVRRSRR